MKNAGSAGTQRRRVTRGVHSVSASLRSPQLHTRILNKRMEHADGVAASTYARDNGIGQLPGNLKHLLTGLPSNDRLELAHDRRERVWPDCRANEVVRRLNVCHPVAHRLVDGILQRFAARVHGNDLRAQHFHPKDVQRLTPHILCTHIHNKLETQFGANCCRRNTMLPRASLGDDARLPQPLGKKRLSDRIVDLVRTRVVEILALQPYARAASISSKTICEMQRRGPSNIRVVRPQLLVEFRVRHCFLEDCLQFLESRNKRFGYEPSTKISKPICGLPVCRCGRKPLKGGSGTRRTRVGRHITKGASRYLRSPLCDSIGKRIRGCRCGSKGLEAGNDGRADHNTLCQAADVVKVFTAADAKSNGKGKLRVLLDTLQKLREICAYSRAGARRAREAHAINKRVCGGSELGNAAVCCRGSDQWNETQSVSTACGAEMLRLLRRKINNYEAVDTRRNTVPHELGLPVFNERIAVAHKDNWDRYAHRARFLHQVKALCHRIKPVVERDLVGPLDSRPVGHGIREGHADFDDIRATTLQAKQNSGEGIDSREARSDICHKGRPSLGGTSRKNGGKMARHFPNKTNLLRI
eukprot:Opistho-2@75637